MIIFIIIFSELEKEVKKHENQLSELEEQQKKILENVRKDTNTLEKQRQRVIKELEKVNFMFWVWQQYYDPQRNIILLAILYQF